MTVHEKMYIRQKYPIFRIYAAKRRDAVAGRYSHTREIQNSRTGATKYSVYALSVYVYVIILSVRVFTRARCYKQAAAFLTDADLVRFDGVSSTHI